MRQVFDKPHRIADEYAWHTFWVERAYGGIECRKEFVGYQHFATCECAHQGGFASVGVADQGNSSKPLAFLPPCALGFALTIHHHNFLLQLSNAVANFASIQLCV